MKQEDLLLRSFGLVDKYLDYFRLSECLFSYQKQIVKEVESIFEERLLSLKKAGQLNVDSFALLYSAKGVALSHESMLDIDPLDISNVRCNGYYDISETLCPDKAHESLEYLDCFYTKKLIHLYKKGEKVLVKWHESRKKLAIEYRNLDHVFNPNAIKIRLENLYKNF